MFELEKAIRDWRSGLLQSQNVLESDADELENHVREEVDSLMLAGLNAQEAFMVSSHRIGDQQTVDQEFAKVNPEIAWRRRAFWMLFGILVSMLVGGIASICSTASAGFMTWLKVNAYLSTVLTSLVNIGVFVVMLLVAILVLSFCAKKMKSKVSVSMALVLCIVFIFATKALAIAFQVFQARLLNPETVGQIAIATSITNLVWAVIWPIVLVALLFVLWASRPHKVR